MTEEAGLEEPHLRDAEYCPRMVTKDDTNLELLMAEFYRLSKLDQDDRIFQSPVRYSFTAHCSVDIHVDPRMTLKDLAAVPHKFHQGRFFVCRTVTSSIWIHSLLAVVETPDPSEEYQGSLLSLGNYIYPVDENTQVCDSFLNPETVVLVKNPLYTKSSNDSVYIVKCDNPGDVVVLQQEIFSSLFQNLKWPSGEPQSEENSLPVKLWWWWYKSTKDWKKIAELRLKKKNYRGALEAYEFALGCNPRDIEIITLRSALYLKFKVYQKSLKDSETILEIKKGNKVAIYTKALSLIGLGRYKLALQFLETHIEEFRFFEDAEHEAELLRIHSKAETWSKQEECGEYDVVELFTRPGTYNHDCANYVGNVRRQDIVGKGRGVVATADIQCGELLIAEKAFAIVYSNDVKYDTAIVNTSGKMEFRKNIHLKLISSIAHRLLFDPNLGKEFYRLFDGSQRSVSEQTGFVEEYDFIDMERITSICDYNTFSTNTGTSTHGTDDCLEALWLFASYFNHSCYDANSANMISGDLIVIRASRNIKKNEEITISYTPFYMPYPDRLSALSKYDFVCQCSLCQLDAKDSDAIQIRRKELLAEISAIQPESICQCSTIEKLITKLTSLRLQDPRRNVYIQKPLMKLANGYEKLRDYERAANIYLYVHNLSSGTIRIQTSFRSCYHVLVCYMCIGKTEEATRCVRALKDTFIQQYGTDSKDIIKFVSRDLETLMTACELDF